MSTIKVSGITNNKYYYQLLDLFEQYGKIWDDKDIIPYGILIKYAKSVDAIRALELDDTEFRGEILRVELYDANNTIGAILHIQGLDTDIRSSTLAVIFGRFGGLRDVTILDDGTAEVEFQNYQTALDMMKNTKSIIEGQPLTYQISYIEIAKDDVKTYALSKLNKYGNTAEDDKIIDWLFQYEVVVKPREILFDVPEDVKIPFSLSDILELFGRIIYPHEKYFIRTTLDDGTYFIIEVTLKVEDGYPKQKRTVSVRVYFVSSIKELKHSAYALNFNYDQKSTKQQIWRLIHKDYIDTFLPILSRFTEDSNMNIPKENKRMIERLVKHVSLIKNIIDPMKRLVVKNIDIFDKLPYVLEETSVENVFYLILIGDNSDFNNKEIGKIIIQMDNVLNKIKRMLNKHLVLKSYVANVSDIHFTEFHNQDGVVSFTLKLSLEYITNADYFGTIGFFKTELATICNTTRYKEDELLNIAEQLHIDISHLKTKEDICLFLSDYVDSLSYADFSG